jgi:hypothetical protein
LVPTISCIHPIRSSLELNSTRRKALIPPRIVKVHAGTARRYKQQQSSIRPVTRRVSLLGLVGLVDPYTHDLSWGAHGDVESDGEADGAGGVQVRGDPAVERGNTGECARGGDDETSVSGLEKRSEGWVYVEGIGFAMNSQCTSRQEVWQK